MSIAEQFDWESLLGRKVADPDPALIQREIEGECVLVTGAGGSIGSALVHALAAYGARRIVMLDASEQNLYRIDADIGTPHVSLLLNVGDRAGLQDAMRRYRPRIVFHGAAFKHVPLMERNPFSAIENNALGTLMVAKTSEEQGVERLILISSDKAADPIGIMGASKRIAELVLLSMPARSVRMTAVRMGNVLGSDGSVFPLFLERIAAGRPVTVTHPEVCRYFATVNEAVAFLLLAACEGEPVGLVMPDLGLPLRIADLAGKLLSGCSSGQVGGSRIVFTQLRPGDKLRETLVASTESVVDGGAAQSASGLLHALRSSSPPWNEMERAFEHLRASIRQRDLPGMLSTVCALVPEYRPSMPLAASEELPLQSAGERSRYSVP